MIRLSSLCLLVIGCGSVEALPTASSTSGTLPFAVSFEADGSSDWTYSWRFGDGAEATGQSVEHVYVASGTYEVELTASSGSSEAWAALSVTVEPEGCPSFAEAVAETTVADERLAELSGAVVSRSENVIFTHQDSGDGPILTALDRSDGETADTWDLGAGVSSTDWEDLATATSKDGDTMLYIGDIGDNSEVRAEVSVYRVPEPVVGEDLGAVERFDLNYPDGPRDAETLLADPQTGDVFILSRSSSGTSVLYAAPSPLASGALTEVARLEFGSGDLSGNKTTTGGDISLHGNQVAIRTYTEAYIWLRDGGGVGEALNDSPCRVPLFVEPKGEALAFTPEGALITLSEGINPAIYRYELD